MYFMSCILLWCKWPFRPFAFNKLIDWWIARGFRIAFEIFNIYTVKFIFGLHQAGRLAHTSLPPSLSTVVYRRGHYPQKQASRFTSITSYRTLWLRLYTQAKKTWTFSHDKDSLDEQNFIYKNMYKDTYWTDFNFSSLNFVIVCDVLELRVIAF